MFVRRGHRRRGVGCALAFWGDWLVLLFGRITSRATQCTGDCTNDGAITVDELVQMVNIALGNLETSACEAADANQDGQITVDEILTAVDNALNGCG